MHTFFQPEFFIHQTRLNEEESHHLVRVLRLKKGDAVQVLDGRGGVFTGVIGDPDPKGALLIDLKKENHTQPRGYRLHIALAPTKMHERFEWFLEKATEIGVDEITPLITKRGERIKINEKRAMKVLVSAMKQSGNPWLPLLHPPAKPEDLLPSRSNAQVLIAHCADRPKHLVDQVAGGAPEILLLIGPEGDFTSDEIEWAGRHGAKEISLGNTRLRTETAGVVACALVAGINYRDNS
jgi:16S rRNA (uracil1498-N3)-methyltransferase